MPDREQWDDGEAMAECERLIAEGQMREDIACAEVQQRWFEMARRMYAGVTSRMDPRDYEIGVHMFGCDNLSCRLLNKVYFSYLRFCGPANAEKVAGLLDLLERRLGSTQN
jgi:hypothetical protein